MDIASPNTEEVTTARWFVMRAYKSEKRAEEKLKGKDGLEYFNKSVDRHINLTNRLLRRFFRGLSNDLENVLNSLLCVTISSNNPC